MGRGEGARIVAMEDKKKAVEALRAWALANLQRKPRQTVSGRGINPRTKGLDLSWVRGPAGCDVIEVFRLNKFFDRLIPDGECVVFCGSMSKGYGNFQGPHLKRISAHRLSYQLFTGKLEPEMVIDHICRNRACVRPDHLRQVTHQENILAGVGATALNSKKTHCINGHKYRPETTYLAPKGRACRICRKAKKRLWDLKNKDRINEYRRNL